jgi:hypothetical protein
VSRNLGGVYQYAAHFILCESLWGVSVLAAPSTLKMANSIAARRAAVALLR